MNRLFLVVLFIGAALAQSSPKESNPLPSGSPRPSGSGGSPPPTTGAPRQKRQVFIVDGSVSVAFPKPSRAPGSPPPTVSGSPKPSGTSGNPTPTTGVPRVRRQAPNGGFSPIPTGDSPKPSGTLGSSPRPTRAQLFSSTRVTNNIAPY